MKTETKYNVNSVRAAGFEARWIRTRDGKPIIVARKPGGRKWRAMEKRVFFTAQREGWAKAFEQHTILGNLFSIPA